MRYRINMSYDGSCFYGYQIQNNDKTVEGEIEGVLSKILNTNINTVASSRTDRGVHAYNQYCHFDYDKEIDTNKLTFSMNRLLDESIYIKSITKVNDEFHSRYDVINKEYVYKINMGEYSPFDRNYIYQYNKKIDENLLKEFISLMSGNHDFRSFTSDKDRDNYERDLTINYEIKEDILYIYLSSSGFLRYMIRNIIGLLIEINDGKKNISDINKIFDSKNRTSLGVSSPGCGLYLNKVEFKSLFLI